MPVSQTGYRPQGEAIQVADWPVQFIPTFSPLTEKAVREAETGEIEGHPVRVVSAVYLAVLALSVGRAKDHTRILALLESGATNRTEIADLAERHALTPKWQAFTQRFPDE